IINILGRLRTHQTVMIASFGDEERIVPRAPPVQGPHPLRSRLHADNVAVREVAKAGRKYDEPLEPTPIGDGLLVAQENGAINVLCTRKLDIAVRSNKREIGRTRRPFRGSGPKTYSGRCRSF